MTNERKVWRDERTVGTENASYRVGYLVLSYGALLVAAYRGVARGESVWDLLALVILGGAISTAYQARGRILTRRTAMLAAAAMATAAALAAVMAALARRS